MFVCNFIRLLDVHVEIILTLFPCFSIMCSKSSTFSQTVEVLSLGCMPIMAGDAKKSSSRKKSVLHFLSFNIPKGVTVPGVSPKIFLNSSLAKLNGLVP